MSKFEDQLFADLMHEHGDELAAGRRPAAARWGSSRQVLLAAGALGLAAAVVVGVNTIGAGSPAYAVTRDSDGTITVSLRDVSGVAGANAELRRLGVRAVAVPMTRHCTARVIPDESAGHSPLTSSAGPDGSGSVTFDAGSIPADDTMVLAAQASDQQVSLAATVVRGAAPSCVPEMPAAAGPGAESGTQSGTDDGGPTMVVSPGR